MYLKFPPPWQQTICQEVRDLVHAADPEGIINQGHHNSSARAIQVWEGDSIRKRAFLNLFKAIIGNNRAGGWRRLAASGRRIDPAA